MTTDFLSETMQDSIQWMKIDQVGLRTGVYGCGHQGHLFMDSGVQGGGPGQDRQCRRQGKWGKGRNCSPNLAQRFSTVDHFAVSGDI